MKFMFRNNAVSTIRISTATTNQNENAATKRTVVSPNSATAKQQLTANTTDSNINKLRLKLKHAVFCLPVPTDSVNVNDRAFAGTSSPSNRTVFCSFRPLYISNGHNFVIGRTKSLPPVLTRTTLTFSSGPGKIS